MNKANLSMHDYEQTMDFFLSYLTKMIIMN